MERLERICSRLPRFYKHWEKSSLIFNILGAVSKQLDKAEDRIAAIMKAHWADTAVEDELSKLGVLLGLSRDSGEDDFKFRARLKRAANEYKGGGTVSAILDAVKTLVNTQSDVDVKIVENPLVPAFAEFTVRAGDTWTLGSNSILDTAPSLTLIVEEEGEVSNPQITNIDTGDSIVFKGKLKAWQQLVIKEERAFIDAEDVSEKFSSQRIPSLLRRGSTWKYSESLERLVGVFDTAKFDEHTFAVRVPSLRIRFDWTRLQPATFEVQVKSKALRGSGFSKSYLERMVNIMKAAGVTATIKVSG